MTETKRERYIRILSGLGGADISAEACRELVELLKEQPHWISCSERLPENGDCVLTIDRDDTYEVNHIIDEEDGEWFYDGVVAWMPLSEPYKGD